MFRGVEKNMTIANSAGNGGFSGSSNASGPTAGYDPIIDFRGKVPRKLPKPYRDAIRNDQKKNKKLREMVNNHQKKQLNESGGKVIDQLKKIVHGGGTGDVTFDSGEKMQMNPAAASKLVDLYRNLNASNRVKMIKTINSSSSGLVKIQQFADSRG